MSPLDPKEARAIIDAQKVLPDPPVEKKLWDCAGLVLAEDVATTRDIPPFNRSAMDGYAVRSQDVGEVPATLEVVAVREAGDTGEIAVGTGQCVKIMTGAAVPADTDSVVMVENTESRDPTRIVTILKPAAAWLNIARQGEDAPKGAVVLPRGVRLTGQALGVAAGVGRAALQVHPAPGVALLQTGGELLEPGEEPRDNKIFNSNATLLAGLVHDAGVGEVAWSGHSRDNREQLEAAVREALSATRLLILTGGVSKGDFDYVPEVLADCGVKSLFHRVAVKPGKPLLFGVTADNTFVFGLPGNPNSVLVSFNEYVLPVLRRLAAWPEPVWPAAATAVLTASVRQKPGRQYNCTAHLFYTDGILHADPIPGHGSGDYVSGSRANGIIIIPRTSTGQEAGTTVPAHFWELPRG